MRDQTRRTALIGAATMLSTAAFSAFPFEALAVNPPPGPGVLAWDFKFPSIEDGVLDFKDLKGRVLLVVNTASFCGYAYQYETLEKLYKDMEPKGLTVVGVPSRDFFQESSENKTVQEFCELTYGVKFPMTGILPVRGRDAHPFYKWVRSVQSWQPTWNFNKILIGRDGKIIGNYGSTEEPNGATLTAAIDAALKVAV